MDNRPASRGLWIVLLTCLLVAGVAYAQSIVKADQGKPGNQGPWPVTCTNCSGGGGGGDGGTVVSGTVSIDGGSVFTAPLQCTTSANKVTSIGTSASACPTAQAAGRRHIVLCNSSENAATSLIKVRVDGVSPVMGTGTPGDVLDKGDCVVYVVAASVVPQCISNGTSVALTSYECL